MSTTNEHMAGSFREVQERVTARAAGRCECSGDCADTVCSGRCPEAHGRRSPFANRRQRVAHLQVTTRDRTTFIRDVRYYRALCQWCMPAEAEEKTA